MHLVPAALLFASTQLTHLVPLDCLILALYFAVVIFIGLYVRRSTNTSEEFFLANREMSAWIAGLSLVSANLGSLELMGWGLSLPIRHLGNALVLNWCYSGNAVSRHSHDAVLDIGRTLLIAKRNRETVQPSRRFA
jgi:hypothetical protein